tara:strand:+ start:42 stop:278 length:237 start_codon:yes stop_codon:yes gene_type:complete
MNNSENILKLLSSFIEKGILTSQDVKKEMINNMKFKKDNILGKLELVSREEFEVLKKIVQKQEREIKRLRKIKKVKKL